MLYRGLICSHAGSSRARDAEPEAIGAAMERMIGIVSLASGRISEMASDTPTLDVPADFIRPDGVVSLDHDSQGHYIATDGKSHVYPAFLRPLSWRARGEEFLVVQRSGRASARSRNLYRLVSLDPV